MSVLFTVVTAVVITLALGVAAFAKGRWSGPWWLLLIGAVMAYPLNFPLDRIHGAPDGWLRWTFQAACGLLVATLLAPAYHRLRRRDADRGHRGDRADTRPAATPDSLS
ncbi:hypothetical protein ACIGAN_26680 [Streptomyces sp. NPDC085931]|uniref:hypothetical protein n=1 Tax=Streptomyces sp. NPDC085931 TaxID=3365740 RepID=UPI0037D671BD